MCGIVGIAGTTPVNQQIFDALTVLQHRGQDSAGMATEDNGHLVLRKHNGLVREVFRTRHMINLKGNVGIGHVRYPTSGTPSPGEAQPFYVNCPYGISFVHNGNLLNVDDIKRELSVAEQRHINTTSDSEILLNAFAHQLSKQQEMVLTPGNIFRAATEMFKQCIGGYASIAMITNHGLVAFRDPNGIRPLIYGSRETQYGKEYCIASESVAITALGYNVERDVKPGEVIYITQDGHFYSHQCVPDATKKPCIFEFVYLARPDSKIDNIHVHKARVRMGRKLAARIKDDWSDYKTRFDVVIPIPSTSRSIALELSKRLGIEYRDGFVKNRYVGRTFIMPDQQQRKKCIRTKLNALDVEFEGKNVLLVDDSIVRGNTSTQIIQMARDAGAKNVYFASAAPPVKYPNIYGIDMPSADELVAHGKTVDQVCDAIGADGLIYQRLEDLYSCVREGNPDILAFEDSVFTGKYLTGELSEEYLDELALRRNDNSKRATMMVGEAWSNDWQLGVSY